MFFFFCVLILCKGVCICGLEGNDDEVDVGWIFVEFFYLGCSVFIFLDGRIDWFFNGDW